MSALLCDDGSFAVREASTVITVTARKDGGAYARSFSGYRAVADATAFRREQESYGCTVTVEVRS